MMLPDVDNAAVPLAPKCTYTRSPSMMGVGDAWLFLGFRRMALLNRNTSAFTASRPVSTSKAMARSDAAFRSRTAVVNQTRPSATTGEDHPNPGTAIFHFTFCDSLHSYGKPRSLECPCPVGPRN